MLQRYCPAFCTAAAILLLPTLLHGEALVSGELRCWHKVTLTIVGPQASESGQDFNPFLDARLSVTFRHSESGDHFTVPGYFAADGDAAESGATSGNRWRAHLAPHKPGAWTYEVQLAHGKRSAVDPEAVSRPVKGVDGLAGEFTVGPTNKSGRDFRARGRLQYTGQRYPRFAGDGTAFIKVGPDSPETLLAYEDFDGTHSNNPKKGPLKSWAPHRKDWRQGDPTWQSGKGKGLIGAVNYLAAAGANSMSFLPYNAGGDGDNVWPMITHDESQQPDKLRYDCSKLDQWQIVFDHAQQQGVFLHFKLQETENDDNRGGKKRNGVVEAALDQGKLGDERRLYLREMVARFGYSLALNWNLGEENTQSASEVRDMAGYLRSIDPYNHLVVLHTYPNKQERGYKPHLGDSEALTGVSLQNEWHEAHERTKHWVIESAKAGHPWAVANDEQGPASLGVPADAGYLTDTTPAYTQDDIRKQTLWGTLMAGGWGVEYYFGYKLAENDLRCQDFRSRAVAWADGKRAIEIFAANDMPLEKMAPADELVTTEANAEAYCLASAGEIYLVYLLEGGRASVDLSDVAGEFTLSWLNPRASSSEQQTTKTKLTGDSHPMITAPSSEDWLAIIRKN